MKRKEKIRNAKINLIRLIKYWIALEKILKNETFMNEKVTIDINEKLKSSFNAINEFLTELAGKFNCSIDDIEAMVDEEKDIDEVTAEEVKKITAFLKKQKIDWHHINWALLGMAAGVLVADIMIDGGIATTIALVLSGGVFGMIGTLTLAKLLDQANAVPFSSRSEDIKRVYCLLKQYEKHGSHATLKKIKLWMKNLWRHIRGNDGNDWGDIPV